MIGAGPKAVAIAAKRTVLGRLGVAVPKLCVIDPKGIAAHWTGEHGYTDGYLPLGTPPEKDVGFPYASKGYESAALNRAVDAAMLRYSWAAFQVRKRPPSYADWVDRGKPPPTHRLWAEYLQWVADQVDLDIEHDEVTRISCDSSWRLTLASGRQIETDGLVVTNPGPHRQKFTISGPTERIFNGVDFWLGPNQERIKKLAERTERIEACVIGSGETAAAIAVQLCRLLPPLSPIDIVSRTGIVYTRGESHDENRLYSNPQAWLQFPEGARREFVRRTDRGVFSVTNKVVLSQADSVRTVAGAVQSIEADGEGLLVEFKETPQSNRYQLVVDATGFRPEWFLDLMDPAAKDALAEALESDGVQKDLAAAIGPDLALENLDPPLHLPMLAAFGQGPGFPNLSCLGLLSDRILERYCSPPLIADAPDSSSDLSMVDS